MHYDIKSVVGFECQGSHRIAGDRTTNIIHTLKEYKFTRGGVDNQPFFDWHLKKKRRKMGKKRMQIKVL